jgi:hypothetical protein
MSLPSWVTPELILGIVGSATGISSLLLSLKKYSKEKPQVTAEVVDATHRYRESRARNTRTVILDVDVCIKNKGDKGITIGEAKMKVLLGKALLDLSQEPTATFGSISFPVDEDLSVRIEPHDILTTTLSFSYESSLTKLPVEKEILFTLFLPHAHGEIKGLIGMSRLEEK